MEAGNGTKEDHIFTNKLGKNGEITGGGNVLYWVTTQLEARSAVQSGRADRASLSPRLANSPESACKSLHSNLANAGRLLTGVFTELKIAVGPVGVPHEGAAETNSIGNVGETELDSTTLNS